MKQLSQLVGYELIDYLTDKEDVIDNTAPAIIVPKPTNPVKSNIIIHALTEYNKHWTGNNAATIPISVPAPFPPLKL